MNRRRVLPHNNSQETEEPSRNNNETVDQDLKSKADKTTSSYKYPNYKIYPWVELAEAFVLWQKLDKLYPPREALMKGTLFPELWKPYYYER